jgi:hypothetical protein
MGMTARRLFLPLIGIFAVAGAWPAAAATRCMASWSCTSSQCASVMGARSGQSGPFDSEAACRAWSNQYIRATCTCSDTGSTSSSSPSSSLSSIPIPSGGGLTAQQNMGLALGALGGAMIGEGLRQLLEDDPAEEARKNAEREARAARLRELQKEKLSAIAYRLLNGRAIGPTNAAVTGSVNDPPLALKLGDSPPSSARGPAPAAPAVRAAQPEKDAYVRGQKDGSDCLPMSAGTYCVGLSANVTAQCVQNYQNGYRVGEKAAENTLRQAYQKGQDDKQAGKPASIRGVQGTCGVRRQEAYNSGYRGTPFTMIGR